MMQFLCASLCLCVSVVGISFRAYDDLESRPLDAA